MKNNKTLYYLATSVLLATFSCQSHEKEADADFEFYKENLEVDKIPKENSEKSTDTLIKVIQNVKKVDYWTAYETEIKMVIQSNNNKINHLKLNSKLKSKTRKQLKILEQNNNDLINLLVVFHEKEQQQLKDFKLDIASKMSEIHNGLNDSIFQK